MVIKSIQLLFKYKIKFYIYKIKLLRVDYNSVKSVCCTVCVCQVALLLLTCLLRPNEQQFWETVTGFLFRPNVLVSFILTGVLNTRSHRWDSRQRESVTCRRAEKKLGNAELYANERWAAANHSEAAGGCAFDLMVTHFIQVSNADLCFVPLQLTFCCFKSHFD